MKKLLLSVLCIAAGLTCWADEYYLVGDATPCGWVTGDARKPMQMRETSTSGVYEWTGLLKHGGDAAGNGFYICNTLGGWSALYPSDTYPISDTGESGYQTSTEYKWNPTNIDWQFYTVTLDTNEGKVSWVAGENWITPDDDGFYNISNPRDLYWFAQVAVGTPTVKAKLTADIDYIDYPKGFIGYNSNRFKGTFDGQEHTVTLDINNDIQGSGLFGVIDGATIKNLVIAGNIQASRKWIGGIAGLAYGNNTVENVVVKASLKFTGNGDSTMGGFFGDMEASSNVKNCAFYGSFVSENGTNIRALASWCSNNPKFTNCIFAPAEISAPGFDEEKLANGSYTPTNCVKTSVNDAKLLSGELCYTMNGNQSEISWYQNLTDDVDAIPVPFSSHKQVFANGALKCDGTSAGGDLTYSNYSTGLIPPHTDENKDGRCDVCGKLIPTYLESDTDGFYLIASASDLKWFSDFVQEEEAAAKAKLTADIDYTAYPQGYIGNGAVFSGVFDGQGKSITIALEPEAKVRGLFAKINGATIRNLIVNGSVTSGFNNFGGLGGQTDGTNSIENVVVNTTLTYTTGSGDASCGGFFPYINSGTTTFTNCAFYGSFKLGSANGNAGLVSWSSGTCTAVNCLIAPSEIEASAFDDFARGGRSVSNCYKTSTNDARLVSGELSYLLGEGFGQLIGKDQYPSPLSSAKVSYVGEAGYSTLYDPTTGYELNGDVKAYVATLYKSEWLKLTSVENVPAGTAVILKGTYYNKVAAELVALNIANELKGTDMDTEADGSMYILAKEDDNIGFYQATVNTVIPAGKAYYQSATTPNVKAFFFAEEGTTAINSLTPAFSESDRAIYNMAGQRISKLQKGVNIVNGIKVLK